MPARIENLDDELMKDAAYRTLKRREEIKRTQHLISHGRGYEAETQERLKQYTYRQYRLMAEGMETPLVKIADEAIELVEEPTAEDISLERVIGPTTDFLSIEFLEAGLLAARSVGRINIGGTSGTGFHVGHQILLTNHHVIDSPDTAALANFELNVEENRFGVPQQEFIYSLNPDRFFLTDKTLDFTLVAIEEVPEEPIDQFGWHVLLKELGKIRKGDVVNIIQHPNGGNKQIVLHNSHLLDHYNGNDDGQYYLYSGDTAKGSSGAPVFNTRWEVIALHHKGVPKTNKNGEIIDIHGRAMTEDRMNKHPEDVAWKGNEGIRIIPIVEFIENAKLDNQEQEEIRDALIALWEASGAHRRGLKAAENNS